MKRIKIIYIFFLGKGEYRHSNDFYTCMLHSSFSKSFFIFIYFTFQAQVVKEWLDELMSKRAAEEALPPVETEEERRKRIQDAHEARIAGLEKLRIQRKEEIKKRKRKRKKKRKQKREQKKEKRKGRER